MKLMLSKRMMSRQGLRACTPLREVQSICAHYLVHLHQRALHVYFHNLRLYQQELH